MEEDENDSIMVDITKVEIEFVLHKFEKGKFPRLDDLIVEFYVGCYEFLDDDFLQVINYSRNTRQIFSPFSTTIIALILKFDNPSSFENFRLIYLCSTIYKSYKKSFALQLKDILFEHMSMEQFSLLKKRQIHEAIGIAQEGMHIIQTLKQKARVLKVDLLEAFDHVCWLYLCLILIHFNFIHDFFFRS